MAYLVHGKSGSVFRVFLIRSAIFLLLSLAGVVNGVATPLLLVDMDTEQVLLAREAGQPWHPASLTKLMTAIVTFQAIDNGEVRLDTPVILSARARRAPPSNTGLPVDTAFTLKDALNILIVKSANDMAIAIAETVGGSVDAFVRRMNLMAATLGLTGTHYVNPHGLHDPQQYTTARDLAVLALTIRRYFPQYDDMFATSVVRVGKVNMRTHNNLLTEFAGTTGMKTGFICAAGLNMVASVERGGRRLLAVVLGASSARERGEMVAQMVLRALNGSLRGEGQTLSGLRNLSGRAPVNMRANICGKNATAYVAAREAAFPYGLEGQESFLTDRVPARIYQARSLGRVRNVPLPRPRPADLAGRSAGHSLPVVATAPVTGPLVPLPRPRP